MTGARWHAMTRFLENHFDGAMLTDRAEGDELVFDVGHDFDRAPTEQEVIDATWPAAARIHNETDPGTFGVQYVGRAVREDLDDKAFCQSYPTRWAEGSLPKAPMGVEDAMAEARANTHTISDQAAQALAHHLAAANVKRVHKLLSSDGFADRQEIAEQAALVPERYAEASDALAAWALRQPTTSDLLAAAPRKTDAA